MTNLGVAIGLLLSICTSAVLAAPPSLNGRVVGGEDAAQAQFPHQVSLRNGGSHGCGGSIISRNFVMTAAHCIGGFDSNDVFHISNASQFSVRAGSNDRFTGGVLNNVVEIIAHEEYFNFVNDVALLRMETPFIFSDSIQPIPLASANTPGGANIIISGWGLTKHEGDLPRYLQYTSLTALSLDDCNNLIGWGIEAGLCLSHGADFGACNGDSGGPAIYNGEVVGIAGFVVGGCGSTNPDGYARVFYHRDWIKEHSDV